MGVEYWLVTLVDGESWAEVVGRMEGTEVDCGEAVGWRVGVRV